MSEHLNVNRRYWDDRAPAHAASADYALGQFRSDPAHLSDVVLFDRPRLGDIAGLRTVHLQCHIGTDTLSLHRLGARVKGLDLSPASLAEARRLASDCGADIEYVEADVIEAASVLTSGAFDLVYTGIGAICWLPDLTAWAATVAALLKPGGRLFIRDMHPHLGSLEIVDQQVAPAYPYFHRTECLTTSDAATYVKSDVELQYLPAIEWSHDLGEILTAVLAAGLTITGFAEHDSVPWEALPGHMSPHPDHPGEWHLREHPERLAASFTLTASKEPKV